MKDTHERTRGAQAFQALGDPTRREILDLLKRGEMTAGALAEKFDMSKPSMSHHFAVLKKADLITSRREGQQIWYAVNTTVVQDILSWAMNLVEDVKKHEAGRGAKRRTKSARLGGAQAGGPA